MKHLQKVNHIGYAVRDINKTAQYYLEAGWDLSKFYEEGVQRTRIAFLTKDDATLALIECVAHFFKGCPDAGPNAHACYNYPIHLLLDDLQFTN